MTTLLELTLQLADKLMDVFHGIATGGTDTTLQDTSNKKTANFYSAGDGGTLWLITSNKTRIITTHAVVGTIGFTDLVAPDVQAGDLYAAAPADFPRYALRKAINDALSPKEMGQVLNVGLVTPTPAQQTYTTADNAIFGYRIIKIEEAANSAEPYDWTINENWEQTKEDPPKLVFDAGYEPQYDYPMRITYLADHPELAADTDEITWDVNVDLLIARARVHAWRWKVLQTKQNDPTNISFFNEAKTDLVNAIQDNPQTGHERGFRPSRW